MRNIIRTTSLIAALALASLAFAHGGFEHVLGAIAKISPDSVSVETKDGKVVAVGLTAKTTYTRDSKKVTAADAKVGDRVVVDATKEGTKLVAASLKLGVATPVKSAPTDHAKH
jgi:hypothetical protein